MDIGISTASFFSKFPTEETFDIIRHLGFKTCEVFLTTFREYEASFVELLKDKVDNINIYSLHTLNQQFEPELFNRVQRTREDCEFFFKQIAFAAKCLGAKSYTFHGPALLKRRKYVHDYNWISTRLGQLNDILAKYTSDNCEIAYENVHWTYFSDPEYFKNLRNLCNIKACLDVKQAFQSGFKVNDYIEVMKDRLVNVHLCDFTAEGKLCMPGKGIFNFVQLFKSLLEIGYNGPLMIEVYSNNYEDFEEIAISKDFLENCVEIAKNQVGQ